jgi:hypothetical protein
MARHAVPDAARSRLKVSGPIPDMLYGYNHIAAFTGAQRSQLSALGNTMVANNQNLVCPFFVVEFKGDGALWVATNQCLGGSASCVNIAEHLNRQLRHCKASEIQPINSAAFSIAMNGTEARLYVSWNHNDLDYYMGRVKSFLLQEPEHYIEFRKYVRNIIDWGKDKRLNEIRASLDRLLEEGRKTTSEAAKSRQPPSNGSATSNGKKHKSSSSRRNSSRSDSVPASQHVHGDVNTNDYSHGADEEPALAGHLWYDQDQSQEPVSFDSTEGPQKSFATSFTSSFAVYDTSTGGLDGGSWQPAQGSEPPPGSDDGCEEARPSGTHERHRRTPAHGTDGDAGYDSPYNAQTPRRLAEERRQPTRHSKARRGSRGAR